MLGIDANEFEAAPLAGGLLGIGKGRLDDSAMLVVRTSSSVLLVGRSEGSMLLIGGFDAVGMDTGGSVGTLDAGASNTEPVAIVSGGLDNVGLLAGAFDTARLLVGKFDENKIEAGGGVIVGAFEIATVTLGDTF